MVKSTILALSVFLFIGCKSTSPNPSGSDIKFKKITLNDESKTLKSAFFEMANKVAAEPKTVKNKNGTASWFSYESSAPNYLLRRALYNELYPQLSKACSNKLGVMGSLSSAYVEGYFEPLEYGISVEEKKLLLETDTTHSHYYTKHNKIEEKDFSVDTPSKFETDDNWKLEGMFGYTSIMINEPYMSLRRGAAFICSDDKKILEAIIISPNFDDYNRSTSNNPHRHYAVYLNEKTLENFIKKQLDDAIQYALDVRLPKTKRSEEIIKERKEYELARKKSIEKFNKQKAFVWSNRFNEDYRPGDKVCSENNHMGYIESANERNVKVWFKGIVTNKEPRFFFGNSDSLPENSFYFKKIDELKWVSKSDIAPCNFKDSI